MGAYGCGCGGGVCVCGGGDGCVAWRLKQFNVDFENTGSNPTSCLPLEKHIPNVTTDALQGHVLILLIHTETTGI